MNGLLRSALSDVGLHATLLGLRAQIEHAAALGPFVIVIQPTGRPDDPIFAFAKPYVRGEFADNDALQASIEQAIAAQSWPLMLWDMVENQWAVTVLSIDPVKFTGAA